MTVKSGPAGPAASTYPSGLRIEPVATASDARRAVEVLTAIWAHPDGQLPMPPELLWATAHAGNYAALAYLDESPVGASVAFRGADETGPLLHSHMTGVLPRVRGASIGVALKLHQRQWALDNDIPRIVWTFDPLVGRNVAFNVNKLGARITDYYPHFYGPLSDGINAGDETDRCVAVWDLLAPRPEPGIQECPRVVLARAGNGRPHPRPGEYDGARALRIEIPLDILKLRAECPEVALAWRHAVRQVLPPALAQGFSVTGFTRDSAYLLHRP